MIKADWRWTTNLMLDLIGYNLQMFSWACFIWLPIAIALKAAEFGGHLIAVVIMILIITGFACWWFSLGIYERKRGRMLVLAFFCLVIWGWIPLSTAFTSLGSSKAVASINPSPPSAVLYAIAGVTLLVGLARRKTLEEGRR
jgi:hypothetical protein